jgi:hypothetical protein
MASSGAGAGAAGRARQAPREPGHVHGLRAVVIGLGGGASRQAPAAGARRLVRTGQLQSRADVGREGQDVADGGFLAGGFWWREVRLDLVAVAAAVFSA